ncbi:hypothetical protein K438DRAFT_1751970 [Mycena galopus ATCC 62051]|nr:hypothetical protein K438DRAFT_1751970 [Mycena galopus ATCC 62051]
MKVAAKRSSRKSGGRASQKTLTLTPAKVRRDNQGGQRSYSFLQYNRREFLLGRLGVEKDTCSTWNTGPIGLVFGYSYTSDVTLANCPDIYLAKANRGSIPSATSVPLNTKFFWKKFYYVKGSKIPVLHPLWIFNVNRLTDAQCRAHEARVADIPEPFDADNGAWEDEILRGNAVAEISHAGEAIQEKGADKDLLERLEEEQEDRIQILMDGFAAQLKDMTLGASCELQAL